MEIPSIGKLYITPKGEVCIVRDVLSLARQFGNEELVVLYNSLESKEGKVEISTKYQCCTVEDWASATLWPDKVTRPKFCLASELGSTLDLIRGIVKEKVCGEDAPCDGRCELC